MRSPLLKHAMRGAQGPATTLERLRRTTIAITGAAISAATLAMVATTSALEARAGQPSSGWIEIPTRISGVTMQFRSLGCRDGICNIEVDTNIPGGSNYKELINCNSQKIQTVIGDKPTPWLPVDRGSVDEVKFHKVCHNH